MGKYLNFNNSLNGLLFIIGGLFLGGILVEKKNINKDISEHTKKENKRKGAIYGAICGAICGIFAAYISPIIKRTCIKK